MIYPRVQGLSKGLGFSDQGLGFSVIKIQFLMYDLGFKIFQWFTVYPRFKVYNLGLGVQDLEYRIQYFANGLTIFIYLFFVTIFMYFYYFILKI